MSKQIISVTVSAWKQLRNIAQSNRGVLFSIESGGCNGFGYKFEPVNTFLNEENIVSNEGFKIEVDESSLFYILGTKIDWDENIMGNRFVFDNPLAKASCGCGTSFSVK